MTSSEIPSFEMPSFEMPSFEIPSFEIPSFEIPSGGSAQQTYTMSDELTIQFVLKIIIYIVGVCGNILVIFMILFLQEFKKITHWYVLQMALADLIFLQNLPFKLSEDWYGRWIHADWLCSAQQTVLYLTYYASIMFLVIMAMDRYLAVCHPMSSFVQKARRPKIAYVTALVTWTVAILMSIPVMLHSGLAGLQPACRCRLQFPIEETAYCQSSGYNVASATEMAACRNLSLPSPERCVDGDAAFQNLNLTDVFGGLDITSFNMTPGNAPQTGNFEQVMGLNCMYDVARPGWKVFTILTSAGMFFFPLMIISACYGLIIMRLLASSAPKSSGGKSEREKRKVTILCALLTILFTVFWLPFHAFHLAKIVGILASNEFCNNFAAAVAMLAYISSATNPYLYNFLGSFKKRMKQIKESKTMQNLLSAAGLTRATGSTANASSSSDGVKSTRKAIPMNSMIQ